MNIKKVVPQFELRYDEEAADHFVKVTEWLRATGMDAEYEIILPQPNQLLLDFDVPENEFYSTDRWTQFVTAATTLAETYGGANIEEKWTTSKSGNCHCIITVPGVTFTPFEAAAWQAAFGSDPKREALHIKSLVMGSKNPNLLIERKKAPLLLGDGQ